MNDASNIPNDVVDRMMVKCGRRCCVCKRFRPTKLQIHHIKERSKGGTDDEDNLIITSISCHSDVHTKVPFSRRFSEAELKQHRESLVRQVAEGMLPAEDDDDTDTVIRHLLTTFRARAQPRPELSHYAIEILLLAAGTTGPMQGHILRVPSSGGTVIQVGGKSVVPLPADNRLIAGYEQGLNRLLTYGLAEWRGDTTFVVTYDGYLLADELRAAGPQALDSPTALYQPT